MTSSGSTATPALACARSSSSSATRTSGGCSSCSGAAARCSCVVVVLLSKWPTSTMHTSTLHTPRQRYIRLSPMEAMSREEDTLVPEDDTPSSSGASPPHCKENTTLMMGFTEFTWSGCIKYLGGNLFLDNRFRTIAINVKNRTGCFRKKHIDSTLYYKMSPICQNVF